MSYIEKYNKWLNNPNVNSQYLGELKEIKNNKSQIKERFDSDLEFGTGGLRGLMAVGTNRMNTYTVKKATGGICKYMKDNKYNSFVIAYDSRNNSLKFAQDTYETFVENNMEGYIFRDITPTPILSYAVRDLKCDIGIVITASHNPKEYNGYKVYSNDGSQISVKKAKEIIGYIDKENISDYIKETNYNKKYNYVPESTLKNYFNDLETVIENPKKCLEKGKDLKVVYTPLHGTGYKSVPKALKINGFQSCEIVFEQCKPDGNFSTLESPNPENESVFEYAKKVGNKNDADILLATDPDCDRIGVCYKDKKGVYKTLTGNQVGIMLLNKLIKNNKIKENEFIIKTIVTTKLTDAMCKKNNILVFDVLTGFKNIAEIIHLYEDNGNKKFLFGFEESYGYLKKSFVRDKDAIIASLIICELFLELKQNNLSIEDYLSEIYNEFGYYYEDLLSIKLEGIDSNIKKKNLMKHITNNYNKLFDLEIVKLINYNQKIEKNLYKKTTKKTNLPSANVLYFETSNKEWFYVRPSGTEPKIKIYFGVLANDETKAITKMNNIKKIVKKAIANIL